ncbi:family S15 peptidase [Mesorhizobium sp. SARCC-RB16n]|uniref:CocE/NonD family hydrolase n=1 Tax=Mesorhizobium sp. SARCC-RB16n TaxID=2116687 RepID=UPI00122F36D9|nr:CocE/NonD family hydrolase [Mesorhizobium sp. SARCC-RB16n]KAA3448145.1 family S15 peptidase [Mesorhizobium sp. SARCC-RB16n]
MEIHSQESSSRAYQDQKSSSIFRLDLTGDARPACGLSPVEALYLTMRDGVKLALDVILPVNNRAETKLDTILVLTRYWRGIKGSPSNKYADLFVPHGYAVVVGDVRGTGASFGVWPHHRERSETLDYSEVLDWVVKQPWSTGHVIGYGLSYTANTADWMAERNHPALKGIIPRFPDYDPYEDLYFPGGIPNVHMGQNWGNLVKDMDRNLLLLPEGQSSPGVRPVSLVELDSALRDHQRVPSVWEGFQQVKFKDDRPSTWGGASMLDWSIQEVADRVDRSGVPTQTWAGWFDGGTAQGAIRRFLRQSYLMNVVIGPWNHGGDIPYDPLRSSGEAILPTISTQQTNDVRFADACFSGHAVREQGKILHYYTLGTGTWKSTRSWPPAARRRRWYMASGFRLSSLPGEMIGFDSLEVDPAAGDVISNRWSTQVDCGKVDYGDRRDFDAARLAYTSEPLTHDLEITGHPVVHLSITSTREDGNFFVYLEAVRPDGVSCYLTDGQLRAIHRKVCLDSPFRVLGPQQSYLTRDAEPLTPGKPAILEFTLHPISAHLPAGYCIRVCVCGSDKTTFANVPTDGAPPLLNFQHGSVGCYIDLPIIES